MIGGKLIRTLPLLPYAGSFGVFSACGCGQCPACLGVSASAVGLVLYIGVKKLLNVSQDKTAENKKEV
ncbi:MAG: hypothetical protein N3C57_06340 [Aquificaceae bacterium]|nr:hypothetical protein [Aquificaceae bacterium]MCX8076635.1 hypothetical protein [Aquificaceae bacterium]MDW8096260.1 hypothetical protein [Aquificaceae bacterium]MDW8434299.1 hypothetical protein [Aquificaceae bacterium]